MTTPTPTDCARMAARVRLAADVAATARRQQVAADRRARIAEVGGIVAATARLILADLNPDDPQTIHARREVLLAEAGYRAREVAA